MRQAVRCALLVVAAVLPVSGSAQLNPTVKVLPRATAPVPAECEQGLSPQPAPRLTQEERASVRDTSLDMNAPPSATLRGEVRSAVEAAQAGGRDAFRDSLTRAKSILSGYPPGAERTTASEVVSVLDDITRLWDFEFTSPTGSFIADGSDIFKIVSRYPGYDAYVRRQVITDRNGIRFYPTRETREFLASIAAERYARLTGSPLPPRAATRETVTETQVQQRTQTPKPTTTTQREPAPRATTHATTTTPSPKTKRTSSASPTHRTEKRTPVVREAHKGPAPKPRATTKQQTVEPIPTPPPTPTTSAAQKAPAPKPATTASVEPAPVVPAPAPSPTTEPTATSSTSTMVAETSTPTGTAMATDTSSTATTSTTMQSKTQTRSRGLVIPLILILVGVGVLVLLLRASS
ncbi:MAG: hypothetical protein ACXW19_09990 [Thermoanaerobaculia bacterium]